MGVHENINAERFPKQGSYLLDDGRYVLPTECQYRPVPEAPSVPKRLAAWVREVLTPLRWRQDAFHGGRQLLAVWRWGMLRWEVWDWGPDTGSYEVDTALNGARRQESYKRIRQRASLLLSTRDFKAAKTLV